MAAFASRDAVGGLALIAIGLFFALHGQSNYTIGELRSMGPGYLPTVLGYVLAVLGLLLLVASLRQAPERIGPFAWRSFVAVLIGIGVFAFVVERFGMVPGVVALTLVCGVAEPGRRLLPLLALAGGLAAIGVLVFTIGLELQIPAFRWGA